MNFHDPFTQFSISIIIAILGIILTVFATIWVYRRQRVKKEISYAVVSDAPIASINQSVTENVEIIINNKPVKDARLLVIKLWNSGNTAIEPDDFYEPIQIDFNGNNVISCSILETEPKDLIDPNKVDSFVQINLKHIELPKFLLNSKESISLNTIITGVKASVNTRGRLANGAIVGRNLLNKQPVTLRLSQFVSFLLLFIAMIIIIVIIGIFQAYILPQIPKNFQQILSYIGIIILCLFILCMISYFVISFLVNVSKNGIKIKWK